MRDGRTVLRRLRARARHLRGYRVPWCVPAWGWAEARATVVAVATGRVTRGPLPARLAQAVADTLGLPHGIAMNRGRTAVEVGLRALGVGPGDEVVMPAYVCHTLLDGVLAAGATPVFADVGEDLNVTATTVAAALTPRTRCVVVPHLYGKAAPIDRIEAELRGTGIALIDDAAQSFGARCAGRLVGSFGAMGVVAIGPGKALAGPAGGVLVTGDRALYERAAAIARGLPREPVGQVMRRVAGYWVWRRWRRVTAPLRLAWTRLVRPATPRHVASTMSNVDAAIGLAQLRGLWRHAAQRRTNAAALLRALGDAAEWSVTDLSESSCQLKLVLVLPADGPRVDEVVHGLALAGVEARGGYGPCLLPGSSDVTIPVTAHLWRRVVCLPTETPLGDGPAAAQVARIARGWGGRAPSPRGGGRAALVP